MTPSDFSIQVYSAGKLVLRLNNVRSNGNFRALKRYLNGKAKVYNWKNPLTINYYYKGVFQHQDKYFY